MSKTGEVTHGGYGSDNNKGRKSMGPIMSRKVNIRKGGYMPVYKLEREK